MALSASSGRRLPSRTKGAALLLNLSIAATLFLGRGSDCMRVDGAKTSDWRQCGGDENCCARLLSPPSRPHVVVNARLSLNISPSEMRHLSWKMAVHDGADIVSGSVRRDGSWEYHISQAMLAELSGRFLGGQPKPGVLLDVGANIGWFTTMAAVAGYHVIALEPFSENSAILQHTLCLNSQQIRDRVTLLPYGLGHADNVKCELWQNNFINHGNTNMICDSTSSAPGIKRMKATGFTKAAEVNIHRLDTLIAEGKVTFPPGSRVVMKIDVEGFEPLAMEGAEKFLAEFSPRVIFSEFAPFMIEQAAQSIGETVYQSKMRPRLLLEFMTAAGYKHTPIQPQHPIQNIVFTLKE